MRAGGQPRERVAERGVAQIDAERLIVERRIEDHAQVGEAADGEEDRARRGAGAELQRTRQLGVRRQFLPARRQIAHLRHERFELRLAAARDADLRAQLLACVLQRGVRLGIRRIQLSRKLEFDDGFLEALQPREPPSPDHVILRGAQLDAIERRPRELVRGIRAHDLRVFDDRAVVLLRVLGLLRDVKLIG